MATTFLSQATIYGETSIITSCGSGVKQATCRKQKQMKMHINCTQKISSSSGGSSTAQPELKFERYKTGKLKEIDEAMEQAVPLKHPTVLYEAMRYSLLPGGKRLAPTLCIAACELVGGDYHSQAMPIAVAIEMLLASAIIVDDLPCMDDDDIRWGKPANHKVYGEATTVLASHAMIYHAIVHITTNTKNVSSDRLVEAIKEISTAFVELEAGQFADMYSEGKQVSLSELQYIHSRKTGTTSEVASVCGALVGGANRDQIERLRRYGQKLGLAYQVFNDILDVSSGTAEKLGRQGGGDLERDKATYPKFIGLDESKKFAKQLLDEAIDELEVFDSTRAAILYDMVNKLAAAI